MGSDHLAAGLLFAELDEAYRALADGREPELPELPIQYADFAEWQRAELDGDLLEELLDYWTTQLRGAPDRLELPSDRPRPSVQSYRGAWKEFDIPAEVVEPAARAGARTRGVAVHGARPRPSRRSCTATAAPTTSSSARRSPVATTRRRRSCSGSSPTRWRCAPTCPAIRRSRSCSHRVRATMLGALAYQELPFEKLVEVLNPERSRSHSPLFQVLFGYDIVAAEPQRIAGHELERLPVPGWSWSRFDFAMILRDTPGRLAARGRRVRIGSVRSRDDRPSARELPDGAGVGRRRSRAAHLTARDPVAARAPADARAVERHRARLRPPARVRADRRAGGEDARRDRGRRRDRAAHVRRAPGPRQPARTRARRRRRQAGKPRRDPDGPPDPAARHDARGVPDRRGVRADRPDVPGRAPGVHARRHPGAGAGHAGEVPRARSTPVRPR